MYTQDITRKRARTSNPHNRSLDISDIEGARPRKLFTGLNRSYNSLRNDDISGSQVKKMHSRPVAPLNSSDPARFVNFCFLPQEPLPKKFIRDSMIVADIEGARQKGVYSKLKPHNRTNISGDVKGSTPRKPYVRSKLHDSLYVKDINRDGIFSTSRRVDPLEPRYLQSQPPLDKSLPVETSPTPIEFGFIEKSKPRHAHYEMVSRTDGYKLRNDDIEGTKPASSVPKFIREVSYLLTKESCKRKSCLLS